MCRSTPLVNASNVACTQKAKKVKRLLIRKSSVGTAAIHVLRKSKLQRLKKLQQDLRLKRSNHQLCGAKVSQTGAKKSRVLSAMEETDIAQASKCTSDSVSDAKRLRAELLLSIEEDPFGDCPAPIQNFEELAALPQYVLAGLKRRGITAPMPIQAQALPLVLAGRDVIGLAQTGSGKTLAFLLPAAVHLERQHVLTNTRRVSAPVVLVMAPTRELAVQIADEADRTFAVSQDSSAIQVHTVSIYGGGDKWTQQKRLRWGADIVVATPGRLTDFVSTGILSLKHVTYFVLDEADRMLDMGFHEDVASIASQVRPQRQMLFFSATWGQHVQELAQGLCQSGSKPVRIACGQAGARGDAGADGACAKQRAREGIVQQVVVVDHPNAGDARWDRQEAEKETIMDKHLQNVLNTSKDHKVLVFVSRKDLADKVSARLQKLGFKADAMHGGKSQEYRLWVLDQFRTGELRLLVCTDVLGRGIDIPSVSHVVIHEMGEIEDYVHRIGRTARGKYGKGHALVFFEYWEGQPKLASELIDLLAASKQNVPMELQKIANEVSSGKRQIRNQPNQVGQYRGRTLP